MKITAFFIFLIVYVPSSVAEKSSNIDIALFSAGKLDNWNSKTFAGTTDYQITQIDNIRVLKATSHAGASGLFKEQRINLKKTPFLNWRWRIDNRLQNLNEQSKGGDDYSARIYVIINGGWAFWKTKALNFVWASNTPKGKVWPNAFAGKNAMMIAVRSSEDKTHTWYQEKRNILSDLKQQFGTNILHVDAIAIMTDTDNAKGSAIAYFGDIFFSEN